jgi:hypothetical protein
MLAADMVLLNQAKNLEWQGMWLITVILSLSAAQSNEKPAENAAEP